MPRKRLRVLIARFGEGYENAMEKLAYSCCEAGFEVVYTNLHDPEAIVACALQESVDHIGITALPGATADDFFKLFNILRRDGLTHIRVTAGGIFPDKEVEAIRRMGVIDFYPRSSIYERIDQWREEYGGPTDDSECEKYAPR